MDPLTAPLICHPQTTRPGPATGTQRLAPGSPHLGRHRQQRPSHWAQGSRFRHSRESSLPVAARRRFPRLSHVGPVGAPATAGRDRTAPLGRDLVLFTLRMVGVVDRDCLRMVGVAIIPTLRMTGVAAAGTGPGKRRGLEHGQSRSLDGSALHRPPAAIAARASVSQHA